jgi:hypothetical protein
MRYPSPPYGVEGGEFRKLVKSPPLQQRQTTPNNSIALSYFGKFEGADSVAWRQP